MLALAVVGSLVEELRWMVAVGEVVKILRWCLPSPARMYPRDLDKMALCVDLLSALVVGGGGETYRRWPRLCEGGGTWDICC